MSRMTPGETQCRNCAANIPGSAKYCHTCGQSVIDIRQPWLPLLAEMLGDVFDWDGKTLTTLRYLLTSPGKLTREFVLGHRKRFTSPVRLYLVVSVLFFFVFPVIMPAAPGESAVSPDELATESYSKMMFVLLPVFALFLKLLYRERFYLQHLVFSMHVFSAMFLVFAAMLSMENPADESLVWIVIQSTVFGYMLWYCLMALKVVYEDNWGMTILKFAALVALFLPTLSGGLNLASKF